MKVFEYYSRPEVQDILFWFGQEREVVGVFQNGSYGQRPNMLLNKADILSMVKKGMIEFHCSLERWKNPMLLKNQQDYGQLRKGWDLVIDLDPKGFIYGKLAVRSLVWALRKHKVRGFWLKFSGGKGFHLGIPWEAIPKEINWKETAGLYPEVARDVCVYLKDFARERLEKDILKVKNPEEISAETGTGLSDLLTKDGIDPWKLVEIDPVLISPRHLFRMPYSINAKTGKVSVLLEPGDVEEFRPEDAEPGKVVVRRFPEVEEDSAEILFTEALEWIASRRKEVKRKPIVRRKPRKAERAPCIKLILEGLPDGRKRGLFILLNYFKSLGIPWERIEQEIWEWNKRNKPPLRDSYVRAQLRYARDKKAIPPPNCQNDLYYSSIGVCKPDQGCQGIKNPVNYGKKLKTRRK